MIKHRPTRERGHANHGWLDTHHTFSFAGYHDPQHMGFRALRVINEDRVSPGEGFGTHPHDNMEILTYVLSGALEHKDSLGNGSIIRPGDLQRLSAGTGITHSEFNASPTEPVHFLQIWIIPDKRGLEPGYVQAHFPDLQKQGRLCLIASPDGRDGSLVLHRDVDVYATLLSPGQRVVHQLRQDRHAWVQVLRGSITLSGHALNAGDGAALSDENQVALAAARDAEVLLFDLD
jgi:redox-sensitive bicupin YhaK (pirin superfamily)